MALSPAHKLGQIIGDALEEAVYPQFNSIAKAHSLYLDHKHPRPARGGKKTVTWVDSRGNTHDLDYVFESGGSEQIVGRPLAFIEVAWRRYTKHSKNKAQEIQGAITPLAELFNNPFLGVVLGGEFTESSIAQLRSHGFSVVYFPYETIVEAFRSQGADVSTTENTRQAELRRKVAACERLSSRKRRLVAEALRQVNGKAIDEFVEALDIKLSRGVETIYVLALSGNSRQFSSIGSAIEFISNYDHSTPATEFSHYELNVRYSNGDELRATFKAKEHAIDFLGTL